MENRLDDTQVLKRTCPFHGFRLTHEIDVKNYESKYIVKNGAFLRNCGGGPIMVEIESAECALDALISLSNILSGQGKLNRQRVNIELCPMGKTNLNKCFYNSEKNRKKIEKISNKIKVFPKGFDKEYSEGIPLKNWLEVYKEYCFG